MVRQPAVAGQFYPGRRDDLERLLGELIPRDLPRQKIIGVMAPHAGYVYSGGIAGATFARAEIPDRVVILGPNHHGIGAPQALFTSGAWSTPLGEVSIDADLATRLLQECPRLETDERAHRAEHSLEVMVPFLQELNPKVRIVPICLGRSSLQDLLELGESLGRAVKGIDEPVLLVASTDMTHYESGQAARTKDQLALEQVLALDPAGLYQTVRQYGISMCGVYPVVAMLAAAKVLGAREATLVHYGNSGDVTGDQQQVVGYAGVLVS